MGVRKRSRMAGKEMRAEYRFDYAKAKPNRFASRMKTEAVAVILDPDVASVFRSSNAVSTFLRPPSRRYLKEGTSAHKPLTTAKLGIGIGVSALLHPILLGTE